jgi:NitT/TauT family transport system substrate-binding protein
MMHVKAALASAALTAALAATPAAAAKLTVTQYGRIIETLPWAVALDKGMFKEAGLDIDGITAGSGGGTSLRNLLASELPFGEVSTSVVLAAAKTGIDLKIVYAASNHIGELAWAAKPGSGINSIKDLAGKKVAFTNPKSTTEMVVRYALKKEGLADKVEALPLGGLGPALTALSQGAVAAAPLTDPRMTLHPNDYKILFYGWQYYPKFSWAVGVTTKEFADKHPDTVRKLVAVHRKAVEFVYAHPKEAAAVYAKVWNVKQAEADAIMPKYYEWKHWNLGDFSKEGLDAVVDGLRSVGEIDGPVDWSKLIDQQYLDKDLQRPL